VKTEKSCIQSNLHIYYFYGVIQTSCCNDFIVLESSYVILYSYHHSYYRNNHSYYRNNASCTSRSLKLLQQERPYLSQALSRKKMTGGINGGLLNEATLKSLDFKRDFLFPLSLLLHNTRPVGRQVLDGYSFSTTLLFSFLYSPNSFILLFIFIYFLFQDTLQLFITIMLLADLSVTLLTLLQFYWISLGAFLAVLLVLPLSLLSPFPAGLNALFSREPRRASLARVYTLWNATSLSNIVSCTKSAVLLSNYLLVTICYCEAS